MNSRLLAMLAITGAVGASVTLFPFLVWLSLQRLDGLHEVLVAAGLSAAWLLLIMRHRLPDIIAASVGQAFAAILIFTGVAAHTALSMQVLAGVFVAFAAGRLLMRVTWSECGEWIRVVRDLCFAFGFENAALVSVGHIFITSCDTYARTCVTVPSMPSIELAHLSQIAVAVASFLAGAMLDAAARWSGRAASQRRIIEMLAARPALATSPIFWEN